MKRIIYQNEDGGISIVIPSGDIPFEDVCLKDVPDGIPYKIVNLEDIPSDRTYRNAWEIDMSNPDGYGIGHDAWVELKKGEKNDNN